MLIDDEISHKDFTTIINEERNYRELKESIRMMESQISYIERKRLIKDDKRIDIDGIIRQNEMIINIWKSQL